MITQLTLENCQPFQEPVTVRFRPITLLIGPNGSGKSTITSMLTAIRAEAVRHQGKPRDHGTLSSNSRSHAGASFDLAVTGREPFPICHFAGTPGGTGRSRQDAPGPQRRRISNGRPRPG